MSVNNIRSQFNVIYAITEFIRDLSRFGEGCAYHGAIACIVRSHA